MLKLFLPKSHVATVFDINPQSLRKLGIRAVIVDLDNTLVPWNVAEPTEAVIGWLKQLKEENIQVIIFSNNDRERVHIFSNGIEIPYIYRAKKPLKRSFKKAAKMLNVSPGEIAVIGDQLLTDMLGGNRYGAYTILVKPIVTSDAPVTKFNRLIESFILKYFYRTGKLTGSVFDGK